MIGILLGFLLILVGLLALTLQRLYSSIPARELKRLARKGDHLAEALYRPVAYGAALRVLLWIIVGVSLAVGLLVVLRDVPTLVGFAVLALTMIVAFVLVPSLQLSVHKAQFAGFLAPVLVKILAYTHRPLDKVAHMVGQYRELPRHSRLYEKQDLTELITMQKEQVDNRIELHELELAERALTFSDKQAADIAQLSKNTLLVNADDTLGPILLDQLHKSGQSSFLVYKDGKENIMGSLSLSDAVNAANKGSRIFDLVRHDLAFVNEDFTLRQVMTAFQKTEQSIVIVINKFEELIGVITFQNLMVELLGDDAQDEDIHYDNRSEVANYKPKEQAAERPSEDTLNETASEQTQPDTSPEATEVVE
jgi:CBS domain containing-hemolysin-like protein